MTLPDCMMPDGADPCRGYAELKAELAALHCPDDARCRDERVRKLEAECERLRELLGQAQKAMVYSPFLADLHAAIDAARKP